MAIIHQFSTLFRREYNKIVTLSNLETDLSISSLWFATLHITSTLEQTFQWRIGSGVYTIEPSLLATLYAFGNQASTEVSLIACGG